MASLFINDLLRPNGLGHAELRAVRGGYLNGISPPPWQGSLPPEIRLLFPPGAGIGILNPGGRN